MAAEVTEVRGAEGVRKVAALLSDLRFAILVTSAPDGSFDSRPMATQKSQFDGTLWFLTGAKSRKADEIAQDSHVALIYADPASAKYLSLKGRAVISNDRAKIHELWSPAYKAWFPDGEQDSRIRVLRVDVTEGEFWEADDSAVVRTVKYIAAMSGASVNLGEHGKVQV